MKLHTYYDALSALIKEHPDSLEYEVYYYSDDEGNQLNEMHFLPAVGVVKDYEFVADQKVNNSICLN
jgi:hypothetical protein